MQTESLLEGKEVEEIDDDKMKEAETDKAKPMEPVAVLEGNEGSGQCRVGTKRKQPEPSPDKQGEEGRRRVQRRCLRDVVAELVAIWDSPVR